MTSKNEGGPAGMRSGLRLPRELEPPADAWDRIAARLERPESRTPLQDSWLLPPEIEPPVDVWPAIAARIVARSRGRRAVAALLAATALGLLVTAIAVRQTQPQLDDTVARAPVPPTAVTDAPRTDLAASLGAAWMLRAPEISSEVAATLRRELERVRDERLTIERALDEEPDNTALRELWAHAYEVELQLADACGRIVMVYERG
jgi:hypothetical protein